MNDFNSPYNLLPPDCPTGGCGAKLDPALLAQCLANLPQPQNPKLLAGFSHSEDAAAYALRDDLAVVSTVDFFPPMLDDPLSFGRIAAANALSDIYAMGAIPILALNLVMAPEKMPLEILQEILAGGAEKIRESGAVLAGGHSIQDASLKYGLAATGTVHPQRILLNHTCQAGDCLILTKPLGTGLVLSAHRAGLATPAALAAAVATMERLNKYAAENFARHPVHAATDVTGFGLVAHAAEMAGADLTLSLNFDSLPLLPSARDYAANHCATAAGQRNRNYVSGLVDLGGLPATDQELLFDPQTSGGLLISLPAEAAEAACMAIRQDDPAAAIVGVVSRREEFAVMVV